MVEDINTLIKMKKIEGDNEKIIAAFENMQIVLVAMARILRVNPQMLADAITEYVPNNNYQREVVEAIKKKDGVRADLMKPID